MKDPKKINRISAFMIYLFNLKKRPTDNEILERVNKKFSKDMTNKQLATYKSLARKGKITGQENPISIPRKKRALKSKEK